MSFRRHAPRHAIVLLLPIVTASCVPSADRPETPREPRVSAPVPPPPPVASPPAPPATPARADFMMRGYAQQGGAMVGQAPSGTRTLTLDGQAIPLAADGGFLIAFDRDAETRQHLVATLADGRTVERTFSVAPGDWRIEHINAPYRGSASSDAEFRRRRPGELAQIGAARAQTHEVGGWRQHMIWPVTGRLSGLFGSQRVYQGKPGSYHSGTDIAVPAGTPFVAPADGVVVLAATDPFTLEGKLLIVDHGMGLNSAFLHCQQIDVALGDRVVQGQRLGTVGATGRATGPHLHWSLKWQGARLDPGTLAGPMAR